MSKNEFIKLYEKFKSGNCSAEEKEFLENFKDDYKLEDYEWTPEMGNKIQIHEVLYARLKQETEPTRENVRKLNPIIRWLSIAAVLAIVSTSIVLFYHHSIQVSNDALPLVKFETRKGQKKQITLSDGTTVWLNSLSSLTLKNGFNDESREVNLIGEAYFDVTHNADKPFKVHTADFNINVLGTAFNIKAYPDDKTSEATLIRGIITMQSNYVQNRVITMKPRDKVIFLLEAPLKKQKTKNFSTPKIIVDHYSMATDSAVIETAWTVNRLEIKNQTFEDIKDMLERWYNIQIIFQSDAVRNFVFTGTYINENIVQVLNSLKEVQNFNYVIDKNKVTISK